MSNAYSSAQISKNAVQHNWLLPEEIKAAEQAVAQCAKEANPQQCRNNIGRAINDLDSQRDVQLGEINRKVKKRYNEASKQYGHVLAEYEAQQLRLSELRNLFPSHPLNGPEDIEKLQNTLVIDKGYYPDGKLQAFATGVKDRAGTRWNQAAEYWKNNSASDMAADAWQGGKDALHSTWQGIKQLPEKAAGLAKDAITSPTLGQDIGHSIDSKLDQLSFSNTYQQGEMAFDAATGTLVMYAGGQVTNRLVNGVWQKVATVVNKVNIPESPQQIFSSRNVVTENITSKKVLIQSIPDGTKEMALKDFSKMGATDVKIINTPKGDIKMGTLPDGSIVKLRPSNDGGLNRQTIEIIGKNGRTIREVRYGNRN